MKKFAFVLPLLLVVAAIGLVHAQEPDTPAPPVANDSVFIIVCDAQPSQVLVLDSNGKWLSSVRTIEMTLVIGDTSPKVKGTMWSGPIKPKTPIVKTWTLAQLKSVTEEEFTEMVDSLQGDPDAIRRRVAE